MKLQSKLDLALHTHNRMLIVYGNFFFEISDKAEDTKTSKKKDEKIKNNKTVELLSKSEEEMPKRRRSPRLIPTSNGANSVAIEETIGTKGQIKPKADWRAIDSPKKRTNEFVGFFAMTVWKYLKFRFQVSSISGLSWQKKQIRLFIFWENLCFRFYLTFK